MRFYLSIFIACLLIALAGFGSDASAKRYYRQVAAKPQANMKYAAFVVDGDTGKIIHQENADKLRHPASLTKMMTLYLLFEALESGRIRMETKMPISSAAASRPQTNLSLTPGDTIQVRDAILALVVRSANDVAVVTAESLAGSEEAFARVMTQRAKQLGMKNTVFRNASGLHHPQQVTTAKEMALLGIALKKHYPQYYHFFSRTAFSYDGVNYTGHNRVMQNYPGADGLKTGFVNASGFNLVTTASRRGINLVGVVLGGRSGGSRDAQMIKLLDQSFADVSANRAYASADYPSQRKRTQTYNETYSRQVAQAVVPEASNDNELATQAGTPAASLVPAASAPAPTPSQAARSAAAVKQQRYRSSMVVSQPQVKPTLKSVASGFIPQPKNKPRI